MVTMTAVTTPMKTIVPLQVLLVKVQRNCVRMVASVSIPAGFVTVKLIVMMVLMRKAATVSTSCLIIVVICWKILKFYICRDLFSCILKFQTISFNCQKKITFLHNLIMI